MNYLQYFLLHRRLQVTMDEFDMKNMYVQVNCLDKFDRENQTKLSTTNRFCTRDKFDREYLTKLSATNRFCTRDNFDRENPTKLSAT